MSRRHEAPTYTLSGSWGARHAKRRHDAAGRGGSSWRHPLSEPETGEVRAFWDSVAEDWARQVGDEGDVNRRLCSDPVLWAFAGEVQGLRVLDAGCGTGYLSRKLRARGAQVVSVDLSERMVELARAADPQGDYRVDSCSELRTIADNSTDLIVSNYVLMDAPDLEGSVAAFARVLTPGGVAAVIFSHPCFPGGRAMPPPSGEGVWYSWASPYFERTRCVDPPWGHFTSEFIWFHRPLSDYWKAFVGAGFVVEGFDEPRPAAPTLDGVDARKVSKAWMRPYSVAFRLRKAADSPRAGSP